MKRRLFISIPLSADMLEALRAYQERHELKGVRWAPPENLHVTVFFCGDVEEADIPSLDNALKESLAGFGFFVLRWKEVLFGPPGRDPRMVWGEFEEDGIFAELADRVHRAARPFVGRDVKPPRRKLLPHITMARLKDPRVVRRVELEQPELHTLEVTSCQLMASELTPEGSIYTVLSTYAFI